jgi:transcriptional regulator with XRE-family HTH domain
MKRKTRGHATDIDAHVGERLRKMREERGMSQEALGQRVDVSFQQIQKYERGANRVGASRLYEFSQVLQVPVETFFNGLPAEAKNDDEAREAVQQLASFAKSKEGGELMLAYANIKDQKARRQILQLIKTLAPDADED